MRLIILSLVLFPALLFGQNDRYVRYFKKIEEYKKKKLLKKSDYSKIASVYSSLYKKTKSQSDLHYTNFIYYHYTYYQSMAGKGDQALLDTLKLIPETGVQYNRTNFFLYLAYIDLRISLGDQSKEAASELAHYKKALNIADWLSASENGGDKFFQIIAIECIGRIHLKNGSYIKAKEALEFANKSLKSIKNTTEYDLDDFRKFFLSRINSTTAELKKQLKKIKDLEFAKKVGEAFLLYRNSVSQMNLGKYVNAREGFEKIKTLYPETPYSKAAHLYSPLCLLYKSEQVKSSSTQKKKDRNQAELELRNYVKLNKYDLYAPESLLEVFRLQLEYGQDTQKAQQILNEIDSTIKVIRTNDPMAGKIPDLNNWPGMKDLAATLSQAPKEKYTKPNFWGVVRRSPIKPEQLMNRVTSKYYFNDLEEEVAVFQGFLHFIRKDYKSALEQYERLKSLDPNNTDGSVFANPNNFTRLKYSLELKRFNTLPQEIKHFQNKRHSLGLFMIGMYMVTEKWAHAKRIASRMMMDEFGRISETQKSYINIALGDISYRIDGKKASYHYYVNAFNKGQKSFSADRARIAAANVGTQSHDKDLIEESIKYIDPILKNRNNPHIESAFILKFSYIQRIKQNPEAALEFLNSYPKGETNTIKTLKKIIQNQISAINKGKGKK
jgi:TolA-binding protein